MKETKKEIVNDQELTKILSNGKPTIIFFDLKKVSDSLLEELKAMIPVVTLGENEKNIAETWVRSSSTPCLFIADSNIYDCPKRYFFGDVNVIESANFLNNLEETSKAKIEIPSKG
jgi:hypothetical protein